MRKLVIIAVSILVLFGMSILLDRSVGWLLDRIGYFHALTPGLTEIHDSSEFHVVAHTSSQGLRNSPVTTPKPAGTYRVLAVGDSFTFGEGVNDNQTFESLVNARLATGSSGIEFINAGKPGASPTEERQICLAYKDRFGIDALFVGMYADDLSQSAYREILLEDNPFYSFVVNTWPIFSRLNKPTIGYSRWTNARAGQTVRSSAESKLVVNGLLKRNPTVLLSIPDAFRQDFLNGRINPALLTNAIRVPEQFTYILDPASFEFSLSSLKGRLDLLKSRCTGPMPVYVVFIPSADQVSASYFPYKEAMGFKMDPRLPTFDLDTPIRKVVEGEGFRYFSLLSAFRADGCPTCYYPYDGHLTPEGQKRLADYVFTHVVPEIKR